MINTAVIGVGYWGPNWVRNFAAHPEIDIKMVCDRQKERLAKIHPLYPYVTLTQDLNDVVTDGSIELVAICTPVHTHFEIASQCIRAGKHVLIEKPMTASVQEAEELLELAEKHGVHIFVDHTFIFTGAVRKIKTLLAAGEIGDLYYLDSVRVNLGLFQHDVNVIWDLAPHDVSVLNHLIPSQPEGVITTGADHLGDGKADMAYITLFYPSNLIAHIHVNWLSPVKIRQMLVAGSKKMVVWDDNQPSEKIRVYDKGIEVIRTPDDIYHTLIQYRTGDMYAPKIDTTEALSVETQHVVDVLKGNAKPLVDGRRGLDVVRILEAAQASLHQRGKEIPL